MDRRTSLEAREMEMAPLQKHTRDASRASYRSQLSSSGKDKYETLTTSWTKRTASGTEEHHSQTITRPLTESNYPDDEGRRRDKGCLGILYNMLKLFLAFVWVAMLIFGQVCLIITLFAGSGGLSAFRGVGGWHLNAFLSILIVTIAGILGLIAFVTRCCVKEQRRRACRKFAWHYVLAWAVSFVMLFLITEIMFALIIPSESLFKVGSIGSDDASVLNTTTCDWNRRQEAALAFLRSRTQPSLPKGSHLSSEVPPSP